MEQDKIDEYRKALQENIFSMIELLRLPYNDIMSMPVKRFQNLLTWKIKVDEEKRKLMEENK